MDETFLTINEYAAQEGVSRRTVQRWLKQGLVFGVKIKGRVYIPADEPSPNLFDTGILEPAEEEELIEDPKKDDIEDEFIGGGIDNDGAEDCEEPCGCDTPDGIEVQSMSVYKASDLRTSFVLYEDAVNYAEPIVPPNHIFRREEDCRYQVVIDY